MAAVNIVIRAVNSAKAAFQEVGHQADNLNKRLQKVGSVFKGLFVGGLVVQFGRKLLEASSYSKQLEESGERVKASWSKVGTDIGDAFARIVLAVEPAITAVGNFFDGLVSKAQFAAAWLTGLATTGSLEEARRIAEEVVKEIQEEQDERMANNDLSEEELRLSEERFKAQEAVVKLQKQLRDEKKKAEEADMTAVQLLARRQKELEDMRAGGFAFLKFPGVDEELQKLQEQEAELKWKIDIVNLEEEVARLGKAAADELAKAEKEKEKNKRPGVRVIKFDRDAIGIRGRGDDMAKRSEERMRKLGQTDPSWRSANYLKDIKDKLDAVLSMKE